MELNIYLLFKIKLKILYSVFSIKKLNAFIAVTFGLLIFTSLNAQDKTSVFSLVNKTKSKKITTKKNSSEILSSAAPVLDENFDYGSSTGDLTTVSGGNWTAHSGANAIGYATTSLSMTGYPSSGTGGSITISGSNSEDVNRTFTSQFSGTVYFSALLNFSSVGSGAYFMHFNTLGFRGRVGAKDDTNGGVLFGISGSSSIITYGTNSYSLNTTYLLIASYEISTGISNLYILTAPVTTEPGSPEATNTGSSGTTLSALSIRQSGGGATGTIDGIRVATTWADLLPAVNTAPVASNVNFSGTLTEGELLTGSYDYADNENDTESGSTFKWYRSDDNSGTGKAAIGSATSLTYTLTSDDVGKYISFEVTPHDGTIAGTPVESSLQGAISAPATLSEITFTQTTSNSVVGGGVGCNNGTETVENSYFRAFDPANFGVTNDYEVKTIEFGINTLTTSVGDATYPVTVTLYSTTETFPANYPGANYTQLATQTYNIDIPQSNTLYSAAIEASVPAGNKLVVEISSIHVAGGYFLMGSNDSGQTTDPYILSAPCGINSPTTFAAIGFPNFHMVLNAKVVTGSVTATLSDALQTDNNTNGVVNPGDVVRYTSVITNSTDNGVTNVAYNLTPDANSTLVAGSVTTTQGTVTTGNTSGDTDVSIDIGSLAANGGEATITFDVVANTQTSNASISAQSTISGTEFTSFQSDDPDDATGSTDATVTIVNVSPSDISLNNSSILENASTSTVVGMLSSTDANGGDTHTYSLVSGDGDDNNSSFAINGSDLQSNAVFDKETKDSYTVRVQSDDGNGNTFEKSLSISITDVNEEPSFTKGSNQSLAKNSGAQTISGWATAIADGDDGSQTLTFNVSNDNNALFSVQPAVDATTGDLTFTTDTDASGSATVTINISDNGGTANGGDDTSDDQTFTINVSDANIAPSFTKGADETLLEDAGAQAVSVWATSISDGDGGTQTLTFNVSNDNNSLFSVQPAVDETTGDLTYTPADNANGSATVTISLSDDGGTSNGGVDNSGDQTFTITVTAVNDEPSFTKGADETVLEDAGAQTISGWATTIEAGGGSDEDSQILSFNLSNDNNSLFAVQPAVDSSTGDLTYTPAGNANGSATVTISVSDDGGTDNGGDDQSSDQTFTITVTAVNDAPSFTKGADETVLEDAGAQTVSTWATDISDGDSESQTLTFNVSNDNNSLFSEQPAVDASGNLTYTTNENSNGSATVTISLSDDGGTSNGGVDNSGDQTFTITVTAVNDEPSFTKGADETVLEDAGAQTISGWATSMEEGGGSDEDSQTLTFNVSNDNNGLFAVQPAVDSSTGNLTYTPADNANGSAIVTISISDDGGTDNGGDDTSDDQTFTITITAVNDVPSFTKGADETILEDAGAQSVSSWATSIDEGGNSDEDSQTLTFNVSNDNNSLFVIQPAIDSSTGDLTYTPADNANGSASVTISISDDGGTSNGGNDQSADQTFTITVTSLNDVPSFTKGADETVLEDAGSQSVTGWATGLSTGPDDESGQTLSFNVSNDNNDLFVVQPAVDVNGNLTYTPADDANGTATVTVSISDDGGTDNGGVDTSDDQTFTINVTAVNDIPSFRVGVNYDGNEDDGVVSIDNWITDFSTGPDNESSQSISYNVTSDNMSLFSVQPTVNSNGTLSFSTAEDANGTTTVTISMNDSGGTDNGGVNISADQTFTISLAAVNDAPTFVALEGKVFGFETAANNSNHTTFQETIEGVTMTIDAEGGNLLVLNIGGQVGTSGNTLIYTESASNDAVMTVSFSEAVNIQSLHAAENFFSSVFLSWTFTPIGGEGNIPVTEFIEPSTGVTVDLNWTGITGFTIDGSNAESEQGPGYLIDNITLSPPSINFTTINEDEINNEGDLVSSFLNITDDVDANALSGIAVTAVDNTNGSWQYSLDGTNWLDFGTPSDTEARLLTGDHKIRFVPAENFNGTITEGITYRAWDQTSGTEGENADVSTNGGSSAYSGSTLSIEISVNSVNDVPSFTKGADETVNEDAGAQTINGWATSVSAGPADESDQTLTFNVTNDNNELFAVQPTIDESGNLTYTPADNINGSAIVTVNLSDNGGTERGGDDTSDDQFFTITVNAVNDLPSFTKGADQTTLEDAGLQSINGWASDINAGPSNESGQTLSFNVNNDNNELFSSQPNIDPSGNLTYTPADNANGSATVTVSISDNGGTANGGVDSSGDQTFIINISPVNDVPSFTKGADESVLEDSGEHTVNEWATSLSSGPSNEAGQTLNFNVSNDNNSFFTVQPAIDSNGNLSYTLADNAFGDATVTVSISDDGGTSDGGVDTSVDQQFVISIAPINDVPSFTKGADQTVLEDTGVNLETNRANSSIVVSGWATNLNTGADFEESETLTFNVSNDNNALFSVQPTVNGANGDLIYTLANNANGSASVTLSISDNGGTDNGGIDTSDDQSFSITVVAVNDGPTFNSSDDQVVNEDAGAQTVSGWAKNISAGAEDESSQTLTFNLISNTNPDLFEIQPAIDGVTGDLTYTPKTDAYGETSLILNLTDNGGVENGGEDVSVRKFLTIRINPVNDQPTFTKGENITVSEDSGPQTFENWVTNIVLGPDNENDQTIAFNIENDNNGLFEQQPIIDANGNLSFTPLANANGNAIVTVSLTDNGGTENGGVDNSGEQTFMITVDSVNDNPLFISNPDEFATEDQLYSHNVIGVDIDLDASLTITASTIPSWLTFTYNGNGNGVLSGTPGNGDVGFHSIVLEITDGIIAEPITQNFEIEVANTNDAPTISSELPTSVDFCPGEATEIIDLSEFADDIDLGDELTYSVTMNPISGVEVDLTGSVLSIAHAAKQSGSFDIEVEVRDQNTLSATAMINVSVNYFELVMKNDGNNLRVQGDGNYQWFKDGVAISGSTGSSYNAVDVGTYKVTITNGDCVLESNDVVIDALTSIELEDISNEVKVYPNPTEGSLNIELPFELNQTTQIILYDIQGKVVLEQKLISNKITIQKLPKGIYIMHLFDQKNFRAVKRIVRQ